MSFYLIPPHGTINLGKLEKFCQLRLAFLLQVLSYNDNQSLKEFVEKCNFVQDSTCLIEGCVEDKISHFMLRLACCLKSDLSSFFLSAETRLFHFRFTSMSRHELRNLFRDFYKGLQELHRKFVAHKLIEICKNINEKNCWNYYISKYLQKSHEIIPIPFQYVLQLVHHKAVTLKSGIAQVPCVMLDQLMMSLFEQLLYLNIQEAQKHIVSITEDKRIRKLCKLVETKFHSSRSSQKMVFRTEIISENSVDNLVATFPPCMAHLHATLRKRHRLSHSSRIQYTLFLKEIGLPVNEAIQFWSQEYSKPTCNLDNKTCSHNWQDHHKRYMYSIRHLYGLEGSKINYKAHCCSALQRFVPGPLDEGGCIFKHFDSNHLKSLLSHQQVRKSVQNTIIDAIKTENYSFACTLFMKERLKQIKRNASSVKSLTTTGNTESVKNKSLRPKSDSHLDKYNTVKMMTNLDSGQHGQDIKSLINISEENTIRTFSQETTSALIKMKQRENEFQTVDDKALSDFSLIAKKHEACFDHVCCPHLDEQSLTQVTGLGELEDILIHKPSDYYNRVRNFSKEC